MRCDYNIGHLGPLFILAQKVVGAKKLSHIITKLWTNLDCNSILGYNDITSILISYLDFPPNKSVCFMCMFTISLKISTRFAFGLFTIVPSPLNNTPNTDKVVHMFVYLTGPPKKLLIGFHEILPYLRVCQIYNNIYYCILCNKTYHWIHAFHIN